MSITKPSNETVNDQVVVHVMCKIVLWPQTHPSLEFIEEFKLLCIERKRLNSYDSGLQGLLFIDFVWVADVALDDPSRQQHAVDDDQQPEN